MTVYAYCLGVNQYKTPIDNLKCAERDARELAGVLKHQFGYAAEYLEERKAEDIEERIEALESRLKPGDQFLFYFSGHGKTQGDDMYLLLPGCKLDSLEASQGATAGVLSFKSLDSLTSRPKWRDVHRIFILDACRAPLHLTKGAGERPAFDASYLLRCGPTRANRERTHSPRAIINSCADGGCALELPDQGYGIFTAALMECLKQSLAGGRDILLGNDYVAALGQRMADLARRHGLGNLVQEPFFNGHEALLPLSKPQAEDTDPDELDRRLYRLARAKGTVAALEDYVRTAPKGARHIDNALGDIEALRRDQKPPPSPARVAETVPAYAGPATVDVVPTPPILSIPDPRPRSWRVVAITSVVLVIGMAISLMLGWQKETVEPAQSRAPEAQAAPPNPQPAQPAAPAPLSTFRDCPDCPEMVVIPGGEYRMGSPDTEQERDTDEGPVHAVSVKRLAMGKHEVTQGEWKSVMGSNPSHFKACGPRCPVEQVSWNDAQEFIRKLNEKLGLVGRADRYRLPSEAEWEYAARAGTTGPFSFEGPITVDKANYDGDYSYADSPKGQDRGKTVEVGSLPANPWGLHEMHGNVYEWVEDCYHDSYNAAPKDGSAWATGCDGNVRVLRGGSWDLDPRYLRSANRGRFTPDSRSNLCGFRLARTLPE